MMKILITGASGFIGSHIVDEALRRDMDVWVVVRKTTSRRYLQDSRINFIEMNLNSADDVYEKLSTLSFDYIVHAAGVTKCADKNDFFHVNTEGTKNFVNGILRSGIDVKKFVYLSSLSIFGAIHEQQPYIPINEKDTPHPNTLYGESKLKAEEFLDSVKDRLPVVVLRPTGVYGPREKDYYMMAKSIKSHVDFSVGYKRQDITFVYVKDVVNAVFLALERGESGRKYFLSDGNIYQSSSFSNLIHKELGSPWWIRIKSPLFILKIITTIGEYYGRVTGRVTALNNDKYNILSQRNWQCDITPTIQELGYKPEYNLERGVKETIAWYKKNNWL